MKQRQHHPRRLHFQTHLPLLRQHRELDAPVEALVLRAVVREGRFRLAHAHGLHPVRRHALSGEVAPDRAGAALREKLVGAVTAVGIGVARDLDRQSRTALDDVDEAVEQRRAARIEPGAAGGKVDVVRPISSTPAASSSFLMPPSSPKSAAPIEIGALEATDTMSSLRSVTTMLAS